MKTQGIYILENTETGKKYLGSSMDLDKRKKDHFSRLISNRHRNRGVQESYNKFGPNSIEFKVVEKFKGSREELYILEQSYLDSVKEEDKEEYFNISYNVFGGGSEALEIPCYILDLNGNIVAEFDSRTEASKYLGLINSSNLTHTASNPSATVKSKKDNSRYRIVNKDYFEENKDEVKKYDRGMQGLYFYEGDLRTLEYIAKAEGVTPETIRVRILQGKLNERRGQFEMSKSKKYYFEGEILTISEIAKIIGCSGQTVRNRIKEGVIKENLS